MSNLLYVKQLFVKMTGRYDLVVNAVEGNWTDAGALNYINDAILELERYWDQPRSSKRLYLRLEVDQGFRSMTAARSIEKVWIPVDGVEHVLEEADDRILTNYFTGADSVSSGLPYYYSLPNSHLHNTHLFDTANTFQAMGLQGFSDVLFGESSVYDTIQVYPPPDKPYTLVVLGKFYEPLLSLDTDANIWTTRFPRTLAYMACMIHAAEHKNLPEVEHWMTMVEKSGMGIEKDNVEREGGNITQMRG